jgi:hypothetical protein
MKTKLTIFSCLFLIANTSWILWADTDPELPPPNSTESTEKIGDLLKFPDNKDDLREIQRQYTHKILPALKQYCGECHWGDGAEADFNLESYVTLDQLLNGRKKWKKVVVRVAAKEMPPEDNPPLPDKEHRFLLEWVDNLLTSVDCTEINPGRVTIRRLNRTEYKNTIRDLMGVNYEPADQFPGDDVGYGFDNIADVLSLPPILMEKYLQAAEEITTSAVVDPSVPLFKETVNGSQFKKTNGSRPFQSQHVLTTNGTITHQLDTMTGGKYELSIVAFGDQWGDEPVKMGVAVNGRKSGSKTIRATRGKPETFTFPIRLKKGENRLEVEFLNDFYEPNKGDRNLYVVSATVSGPIGALPRTHLDLIPNAPKTPEAQRVEAEKVLNVFMSRAYRRRATQGELSRLMSLYDQSREDGQGFEVSLRFTFQAVLVSPYFLYKVEAPTALGKTRNLNDFEIATSLSYFLWSSMPDAELFRLAARKELSDPAEYRRQIARMLKDPKANALVENFVEQWLQLGHLEHFKPDPDLFPGVNTEMQRDMVIETKLLFADLIKRNASILDALDSDSSFINQRLAEHYGIPGVRGENFRKVSMAKYGRGGLMTQASVLTLTSNPTRTSPVKRGKWILENLLGEEPPPPDPAAMQLEDQAELTGTLRQRMEQHRADPACAVCHKVMDQLGFALENYDAVGKWRDTDQNNTIDSSGELPDGTRFKGAIELQETLKTKMKDQFVRCMTEKMLIYALGRGLEYFDECSVDKILAEIEPGGYRFSDLIIAIANSDPFVKRIGPPTLVTEE